MTLSWQSQFAWIGGASAIVMVAMWLLQRRTRDAGVVDVAWSACLAGAALLAGVSGEGDTTRRWIIAIMGATWGARLAIHLLRDRVLEGPEDGRYQMMRRRFGSRVDTVFFWFFLAQAVTVVMLSAPFVLTAHSLAASPDISDIAGAVVWLIGLVGESVADHQLKTFKRDTANKGRVCNVGLWRYSRHPNYFFEWLIWVSFALVATNEAWTWLAWSAPAMMLLFILKLTGIPPTEARAIETRGEAYREYQRTTSAFFPWFPRATGKAGAA